MRKLLYTLAGLGALALFASCNKEADSAVREDGATVKANFTVQLPEGVETKAISDGTLATELLFMAYDQNGNHLGLDQTVPVSGYTATVSANLVKGVKYQFVFWAQKADQYTSKLSEDKKTLTVAPAEMMNSDAWDAFYAYENLDGEAVSGAFSKPITLRRPFAQINVGAPVTLDESNNRTGGDFFAAEKSGLMIDETLVTGYTIKAYTSMNLLTGAVYGMEATAIPMTKVAHPTEFLTVDEVKYDYAAMAYVLAEPEAETYDLELNLYTTQNGTDVNLTRSVPNVPIRRNYRTNILGNVFSVTGNFNITVDQNFYKVDEYNDDYFPQYASIEALNEAFAAGKGIGYTVEVAPAAAVSGAQTIMLLNTQDEVSIFFRGDFSAADITIVYSDAADAKKPGKLTLEAPLVGAATKSINKLVGNLPATTVVLAGTTTVDTADFHTASNTLHIMPDAKILNKLTVYAGSLLVEGFIETAVIDPAVAVNTADAVATVAEDGEVVRFVVQNLTTKIESGAKVGTLEVTANGAGATAPVTIAANATVTNIEISAENGADAPAVVVNSEADVTSITGDTSNVKNEDGASLCVVHNLEELNAALSTDVAEIYFDGEPITSGTVTISRNVQINGLKWNATNLQSIVTQAADVRLVGAVLNFTHTTGTGANKRMINVASGKLTMSSCTVNVTLGPDTRALRAADGTEVILESSSLTGAYATSAEDLKIGEVDFGNGSTTQGLGVGGNLTVKNSSITGFHYAIRTWNSTPRSKNQIVTVEDSFIDGWGALYLVDDYSTANVKNSTLVGRSCYAGETNGFSIINVQPDYNEPANITLEDIKIISLPQMNHMSPITVTDGTSLTIKGQFAVEEYGSYSAYGVINHGYKDNGGSYVGGDGYCMLKIDGTIDLSGIDSPLLAPGVTDVSDGVVYQWDSTKSAAKNGSDLFNAIKNGANGSTFYVTEGVYEVDNSVSRLAINKAFTLIGLGKVTIKGTSNRYALVLDDDSNQGLVVNLKNLTFQTSNQATGALHPLYFKNYITVNLYDVVVDTDYFSAICLDSSNEVYKDGVKGLYDGVDTVVNAYGLTIGEGKKIELNGNPCTSYPNASVVTKAHFTFDENCKNVTASNCIPQSVTRSTGNNLFVNGVALPAYGE